MLSFYYSSAIVFAPSGKQIGQIAETGDEGNNDISKDDHNHGMDQGDKNTAFEHFVRIQSIADWNSTDADGQEPLGVE